MASWILVPCLVSLRDEFNALAPARDKASDGSIGDTAHAYSSSDHNPDETGATPYEDADKRNEVHAIDTDDDLRLPGWTMAKCIGIVVMRHRTGLDDRLQNIIYDRRIYSRSWGWTAHAYNGPSPHTEHAHFSARYTDAAESNTKPWGLLEAYEAELKEKDVSLASDKIKLSKSAAAMLDPSGKTYKEGQEISGETVINLLLIWATRGGRNSDAAKNVAQTGVDKLGSIDTRLGTIEDWVNSTGDPGTPDNEIADNLKAVFGPERARAIGLLLQA